jgi:hypothetical protein
MTAFNIEFITDQPDCVFVEVARGFNVVIERTETGLSLRIYPRTGGDLWDVPFDTFEIDESEIVALETKLEAQP